MLKFSYESESGINYCLSIYSFKDTNHIDISHFYIENGQLCEDTCGVKFEEAELLLKEKYICEDAKKYFRKILENIIFA